MKDYLSLIRIKHCVKNLLVFIPLFFATELLGTQLFAVGWGFICFCLASSAVYIFNDLRDAQKDRMHSTKKNRPIAAGRVSSTAAIVLICIHLAASCAVSLFFLNLSSLIVLAVYLILNAAYSLGLKNQPILDIVILASGFVLRIIYGGVLADIAISNWLYLVVITGSLYMVLGKRRNEMRSQNDTREVLKHYTYAFLDKNMYVFSSLVIVFYSLWTVNSQAPGLIFTVPLVIVILLRYSFIIEGDSDGDPVDVLFHDKPLIALTLFYIVLMFVFLYVL